MCVPIFLVNISDVVHPQYNNRQGSVDTFFSAIVIIIVVVINALVQTDWFTETK